MTKCLCEWCEEESKHIGYCNRHYQQFKKWGECRFSRGDKNQYVLYDDYAEIILYDKELKEKARAIIDLEDVEKCKPFKWTLRNDGYVSTKKNYKAIKLHRFVMNTPENLHADHENRNRLDNRKSNLKICTQQENNKNKSMYITNTSGGRGILKAPTKKIGFIAEIRVNGKLHYLGTFGTFNEALKARKEAELNFYGYTMEDL